MKNYFAIASMGLALSLVSYGEKETETATGTAPSVADGAYTLSIRDRFPTPGKTFTVNRIADMKDAELDIAMGENQMKGEMTQKSKTVETIKIVSEKELHHLIVSESDKGTLIMEGQEQPTPEKVNPLIGIPVIVAAQDGKYTATMKEGAPTPEQQTELDKILKKYAAPDDVVMYGDVPRKPGDRWDVDPSKLSNFAGGTGLTGTFTVEFKSVEEINGVNRARLECVFDIKGKTAGEGEKPEMSMSLKGKADVVRSIQDRVDLEVNLTGTMAVEGAPAEGMVMKMTGSFGMTQTTEVK